MKPTANISYRARRHLTVPLVIITAFAAATTILITILVAINR